VIDNLRFPNLARLSDAVLRVWPTHEAFLTLRFQSATEREIKLAEELASHVVRLAGEHLSEFATAYRRMCEAFIAEDLFFRRHGRYRLTTFEEANKEVYSRAEFMRDYLRGILLSQVLFANQTAAFQFYVDRFLPKLQPGAEFLEIGPGHGLLIFYAAQSPMIETITGWDISTSSLEMTRRTLDVMGATRTITLDLHDILRPPTVFARFDAIVVSEVLEHLDNPDTALLAIREALRPGGLVFFNTPINSPAPDHIYNWDTPDNVESQLRSSGFEIVESKAVAATGYELDRAMRKKVTVNTVIIATRS
jgi:2-polyprenyl-3-methyl-5-hydroxy-6-metoxy-1,4-benzoquinol methylase